MIKTLIYNGELKIIFAVMYAPWIGHLGLDMVRKAQRRVVWIRERKESISLMNAIMPWYPETTGYKVCTISLGQQPIESTINK